MLVTVRGKERSLAIDLDVSISVTATATRNIAGFDMRVDRESPLWSSDYISEDGGNLVTVDPGRGRKFYYISDVPQKDGETALTLPLMAPEVWLATRRVAPHREFRGCSAGTIAYYAILDGVVGIGNVPISAGSFVNSAPHVDEFIFNGQTVLNVLTSLTEQTGQEWYLDRNWRFIWVARQGRYREIGILINDGDMKTGGSHSLHDLAREIIEVQPDGREWRLFNHNVPNLWQLQDVVRP